MAQEIITPPEKTRRELLVERITNASGRSLTIQVIMIVSAFAGLCSTMFPVLKSLNVSDSTAYLITAALTVVVIVLLVGFFFINSWKVYLVRATVALLLVFSLALCGLLYWQYLVNVNEWQAWNEAVTTKANECEKLYQQKRATKLNAADYTTNPYLTSEYDEKVLCIGEAVRPKYPHQGQEDQNKRIIALNNDVQAGTYLMGNEVVAEVLKKRLGIGGHFLGTGMALPSSGKTYGDARLVEYLVPNLSEQDNKVLAWQINPLPNLSQSVECLIVGCINEKNQVKPTKPSNINAGDEQKYENIVKYINESANRADDNKVILIRLNQFDRRHNGRDIYSKRLGREEASSVFMIRLRDVWNVSLKEAITLSGHEGSGDTLFVWVYTPTAEGAITLATWKNIIPNIEKLLKRN